MEFECQYVRIPENKQKLNEKINYNKRKLQFFREQIDNYRIGKEINLDFLDNISNKKEDKKEINGNINEDNKNEKKEKERKGSGLFENLIINHEKEKLGESEKKTNKSEEKKDNKIEDEEDEKINKKENKTEINKNNIKKKKEIIEEDEKIVIKNNKNNNFNDNLEEINTDSFPKSNEGYMFFNDDNELENYDNENNNYEEEENEDNEINTNGEINLNNKGMKKRYNNQEQLEEKNIDIIDTTPKNKIINTATLDKDNSNEKYRINRPNAFQKIFNKFSEFTDNATFTNSIIKFYKNLKFKVYENPKNKIVNRYNSLKNAIRHEINKINCRNLIFFIIMSTIVILYLVWLYKTELKKAQEKKLTEQK